MANQYARPSGIVGRLFIAPHLNRINSAGNTAVFEALQLESDSRALEIGFGGGDLLFRIASRITQETTHGLELSAAMIERVKAGKKFRTLQDRVRFDQGNSDALPYTNRQFDRICSINTVYFWPDLESVFAEIARVAEPAGILVLGYGSHRSMRDAGFDVDQFVLRSPDDVSRALVESGFERETLETINRNKRRAFHISTSFRCN